MAITWADPIKGYLAPYVASLQQETGGQIDLSSYQSVKDNLNAIWARIKSQSTPFGELPDDQIGVFQDWMDAGAPESAPQPVRTITWVDPITGYLGSSAGHMRQVTGGSLDLGSYQSVKTHLGSIWGMIRSKAMPPGGLQDYQIQDFQAWIQAGAPEGTPQPGRTITWADPIQSYFDGYVVAHMRQISGGNLDLSDYTNVKSHAKQLWAVIAAKAMPPGGWPDDLIQNFGAWVNAGCPES